MGGARYLTDRERILRNVSVDCLGCWNWTLSTNPKGYGRTRLGSERLAHRAAWKIWNGKITGGSCVLHRCDNTGCCNPAHLFLGSRLDNNKDMMNKRRSSNGERQWNSKISDDEVRTIREVYSTGGTTQRELAFAFSISLAQVSKIVNMKQRVRLTNPITGG